MTLYSLKGDIKKSDTDTETNNMCVHVIVPWLFHPSVR